MASALMYGAHAQAQQATASRMTASATSVHNAAVFVLRDSSNYTYTNDRGGDLTHDMKFDRKNDLTFNTGTGSYVPTSRTSQTFDGGSRTLSITEEVYDAPSSSWLNSTNTLNTYNGQGNLETTISQYWNTSTQSWGNNMKSIYFYNGDNTLDTTIRQYWDQSTSWINSEMMINNYDINGNLLIQTNFSWDGSSMWLNSNRMVYSYNADVLEADIQQYWNGSSWINYIRHQYTYDGAGNMLSDVYSQWLTSTSSWRNINKTTNVFNMNNDKESMLYQTWITGSNTWLNVTNNVYSYDTSHNNTLEVTQNWISNMFRNMNRYQRTYNNRNQMTAEMSQRWNIGGFWENLNGDTHNRYYYQTYTLGIKATNNGTTGEVRMYPVPANNVMTLDIAWKQPQDFTVMIVDMTGRLVRQWAEKSTEQYRKQIPVGDLATGNYLLQIKNGSENIVKQFSVAH